MVKRGNSKMKRKSGIILAGFFMGIVVSLTGCTQNKNQDSEVISENNTKNNKQDKQQETKEKLDLEKYNLDYVQDTDFQTYFQWSNMAKAESGYYLWNDQKNQLVFFDIQSEQIVPVCNRPDCNHKDITCNADFSTDISGKDSYSNTYLQYYQGEIYIVGIDGDDYVNLYKVSRDGNTRKKYMQLYKADLSSEEGDNITDFTQPEVCIHRGYVYFIDKKESMPSMRKMKLGTNNAEILHKTKVDHSEVYRMQACGDYLFFQTAHYTDKEHLKMEGGIYAYNIVTGEIFLVKKDAVSAYYLKDEQLYYSTAKGIQKYDLKTLKNETIIEAESEYPNDIYVDDKSIYKSDWAEELIQYDKNGKFIEEYTLKYEDDPYMEFIYGDENYLFCKGKDCFYTMSKEENAEKVWIKRIW